MASRCVVRDKSGNAWGPFERPSEINEWVKKKWPDQQQDERRTGVGWDIEALRDPDEA